MSIITSKNKSQSAGTRTDSLNARPAENRLQDDAISPSRKLSTLLVTNLVTASDDADAKENRSKDDHEHPCVCDLSFPRKPLTNAERYSKAKDYSRTEIKSRDANPSRKIIRSIHASPVYTESSNTDSDKNRGSKNDDRIATPLRKKLEKVYKILGDGYKVVRDDSRVEGKSKAAGQKSSNEASSRSTTEVTGSSSSKSVEEADSSPRKNIRWRRGPIIDVKLNRTAALRLEKGNNVYCGYKPPPASKVDEYFAKRAKKISAARAKAKADALAAALKEKGGAGGGGGSSREEDYLAGQKCEYMRCRRYNKK